MSAESARSTLVQLLYRTVPALDFPRLVADLERALAACLPQGQRMVWDHDDLVLADLPGSRILLAFASGLDGRHAACLTISVGAGPLPAQGADVLASRQGGLVRMIADRIQSRHPADALRWHRTSGTVGADLVDTMTEALPLFDCGGPSLGSAAPLSLPRLEQALAAALRAPAASGPAPGLYGRAAGALSAAFAGLSRPAAA